MSTLHTGPLPHAEPAGALQEGAAGITFGPVLCRRFGRSLGVNNLTPKVCPYSCVYCQRGRTVRMSTERRPFHGSHAISLSVTAQVTQARRHGEPIHHIVFVPQGEPTLDEGLGRAIHVLRPCASPSPSSRTGPSWTMSRSARGSPRPTTCASRWMRSAKAVGAG